jgi:hypothetical protein
MVTYLVSIISTLTAFSLQASDVRYEPEFEKKCFKEVNTLKCGKPEGKNEEAFMKCVDSKISRLSPSCREMHKSISDDFHSHHKH